MKKRIAACLIPLLVLAGCSRTPELPENPIVFQQDRGDGYMYLTVNDRIYVPYCPFRHAYMGECIGYYDTIPYEYSESSRVYVYEFEGYPAEEWIVDYDPEINEGMVMRELNATRIPDGLTSEYAWNP